MTVWLKENQDLLERVMALMRKGCKSDLKEIYRGHIEGNGN